MQLETNTSTITVISNHIKLSLGTLLSRITCSDIYLSCHTLLQVRQSYPFKTRGLQACESARAGAMQEVSRVINSEGTVVKTKVDGSLQVHL